ncbi:hypothetical protein BJV82DRAFT_615272 [Fennellomyces sp. T-0311]|nr:hypothetical protein BJV82DRAFT_615272 [Fennellomyces sp. T-0311]
MATRSATKGPAFEIRFCDDNRVQVFDLSGPHGKQLPFEYREDEVLEGHLRYSKLIGYTPPKDEQSPTPIRPKVSQANQEIIMQNSLRRSEMYSMASPTSPTTSIMSSVREEVGSASLQPHDGPVHPSANYMREEAPNTPIPTRVTAAVRAPDPVALTTFQHSNYSAAPSMNSHTVVDEKYTSDNECLYAQNERQQRKSGCCCVIS